jgi:peptidyl-Lys metalloendopeptidase
METSAMKKLQVKWLALGAVSALFFAGCVAGEGEESVESEVGGADVALDPVAGEVSVKLAVDKTVVNSVERVVVKVTLANDSDHAIRVLSWYAPSAELEEDIFTVARGAEAVEFVGPHYKRPAPTSDDYVILAAGQSVTGEVDLTNFYDFAKGADYTVKYNASFLREGGQEVINLSSNQVSMWIGARNTVQEKPSATDTTNVTGLLSFTKCTTTQAADVTTALNAASVMANGAATYLGGAGSGTPRYTEWFGAYSANGWNTAKTHYTAIKDAIDTKALKFDCGCKKTYYAYVYPAQPYNVYLCKAFWSAPVSGTDSRGGTIIHELSHFNAVAGTDDFAYGQTNAKALAISNPAKALDNADNHEYFAENTPSLQ